MSCGVGPDAAQILHCCGCGVGWQVQLLFHLSPENLHMPQEQPLKKKKILAEVSPTLTSFPLPNNSG